MAGNSWPNLVAMFFDQAARYADKPFLWAKRDGQYRPLTWAETADRVDELAAGLRALGVEPGERVVLISENRPEWLIADLAVMAAGAVTVPAYTTNTPGDHQHILENSAAAAAIVSTRRLGRRFLPAARNVDGFRFLVTMEPLQDEPDGGPDAGCGPAIHTWEDTVARGGGDGTARECASTWTRQDTACIIYTSGTGGAPKGVMLHHGAILHNCSGSKDATRLLDLGEDDVFLSFLPLSHSYEHTAGQFLPMVLGAQIYYADGVETLSLNMTEARPTIMTAVPRLYEMMHGRITQGVAKKGGVTAALFNKAVELGRREFENPGSLTWPQRVLNTVLDRVVRDKVRARFGGRLKALVSGGAPLNPDIGLFFAALGVQILQGYGQTESAPVVSVNRPDSVKMDTVGPPLRDVEVKIADDGEILVRGELVMQGYWRNVNATNDTIRDGWLHTGDIGEFDAAGRLRITDRKKDIIVNSGGDNLSPQRVEGMLCLEPEIFQAMVSGDRKPHLVALLVADERWTAEWAKANGKKDLTPEDLAADADFHKAMGKAVDRINKRLSNIERIRRFVIAPGQFTVENEQMTPTMKIRRHKILETYGEALEALYG